MDGFTLSEIMISLGLVSLLAVALLASAQTQIRLHREQNRLQGMEDNARAALSVLAHDARLLGAPSRGWGYLNSTGSGPTTVPIYHVWDNFNQGTDRLDSITPTGMMLSTTSPTPSQPGTLQVDVARFDLDALQNPLTATPATSGFQAGDYVILSNITTVGAPAPPKNIDTSSACSPGAIGALLLRVTAVPGPDSLTVSQLDPGGCTFPRGSLLSRANVTSYYVDDSQQLVVEDGGPLRTNPLPLGPAVPLAESIVDLQIALGTGLAGDAEWLFNFTNDLAFPVPVPSALRITIVARTPTEDFTAAPSRRPAVENHPGGDLPDHYRYRVLTTTVVPRNLVQP